MLKKMTKYEKISIILSILALIFSILISFIGYLWLDPTIQQLKHQPRLIFEVNHKDVSNQVILTNIGLLPAKEVTFAFPLKSDFNISNPIIKIDPPVLIETKSEKGIYYIICKQPLGKDQKITIDIKKKISDMYIFSEAGQSLYIPLFRVGLIFRSSGNPTSNSIYLEQVSSCNDEITLAVKVKGGTNVYGAAIEIDFDSNKISYVSASESNYLNQGKAGATTFMAGLANGNIGTLSIGNFKKGKVSGINGDGTLCQIVFKALFPQTNTPIKFYQNKSRLKSNTGNIIGTNWFGGSLSYQ